ncbi:MAG: magnesium chelatase, partial [Acidimicrobiales bacterium]
MTVTNYETLIANATRRALQAGETHVVPRVSDLEALMASSSGKIEIESIEEGRDGQIVLQMLNAAVLEVF